MNDKTIDSILDDMGVSMSIDQTECLSGRMSQERWVRRDGEHINRAKQAIAEWIRSKANNELSGDECHGQAELVAALLRDLDDQE